MRENSLIQAVEDLAIKLRTYSRSDTFGEAAMVDSLFIIPRKNAQTFICILSRERQNAERGIIKQRNCLV